MERSKLKNKANKSRQSTDITSYKKQRNLVVSLNRKSKLDYFNSISSSKRPYFSKKHAVGDSKIMLTENDKMTLDNEPVSEKFNNYFSQIVDSTCMNFLQNRVENMLTRLTILCQNSKLIRAL